MKYIDIHGHLNFVAFDNDRNEVIESSKKANVTMVTVGTQLDTSKLAVKLAEENDSVYAIIGLHPIHTSKSHHDVQELGEGNKEFTSRGEVVDIESYKILAKNKKTVAIGECGLDYYHADPESESKQIKAFEQMIDLANEVNKPLMLHLRNGSGKSAYLNAYDILPSRSKVCGDLHFFAGNKEEAKPFLDLGYYFSFTGVITFTRDYDEVIKYLPLDRIMSETDCPYVSPLPYRGKRNEPAYVVEVVKAIARIKGREEDFVARQIIDNANRFFSLSL